MLIYLLDIRRKTVMISQIIDQSAFCLFYQNHLNVFYMSNQIAIQKIYFQNIRDDLEKKIVPSMHYQQCLKNGKKYCGSCGALCVDLSKAFDCIVHDLVLAKLSTYGFDYNSLKLINSFLSGRKFRAKIGSSYSPYLDLLVGVPQGSILGPLLFNIYMCDIFLCNCESNNINYEEDITLYACELNMDLVLSKPEKDISTVFTWFQNKYLKVNSGKSHLVITSDYIQHINVGGNQLSSSKCEELLGILKDHKLTSSYIIKIINF